MVDLGERRLFVLSFRPLRQKVQAGGDSLRPVRRSLRPAYFSLRPGRLALSERSDLLKSR